MSPDSAPREFHISRHARERYQFDAGLYALDGNVVISNFVGARVFAQRMNRHRDLIRFPEQTVRAGDINALGLIDEIMHLVIRQYRAQLDGNVLRDAHEWVRNRLGTEAVELTLATFVDEFPPLAVYRQEITVTDYIDGRTEGESNREIVLEELLVLWIANMNPALAPFGELFDDSRLERETVYLSIAASLYDFFDAQPRFGPGGQNLIDMLRSPALAAPHSLAGQLEYILKRWGSLLGPYYVRVLSSLDLIQEEQQARFSGPGPAQVPVYSAAAAETEPEQFTPDRDWMPELVLIAKNSYVWLSQLAERYQTLITRLDQIPDAELDRLARWGFTGLWLIGVWERSAASRRIKQMMGNPEAAASAYSIFDYRIASDLGGDEALADLRARAWQRGIRLASDMVPNHMAIDSQWVIEHPDWFVALDASPFPAYSFDGPDLSWDSRVGIFLEDHYYDRSDAAVVFRRLDRWTGNEKYIYHGNDGTSMPWNDTAQLNYLSGEVREAVTQMIVHIARQFPVIRFDAAMTLAKKQYERLWFPEPGSGGAIPSRAEHGLTRAQFDAAMPEEFWRQVVERVAVEAPDTLLLAEAFWMMESYFVRTLGMHRVYNSAFMNMLRDEENAKYRAVMKNTLEFDPEILKRYVNFMNNPDERTAIDQFGSGDKYFGICVLMATLPGLPMFGHGQIEGYAEKYGMEYQRAYGGEQPDLGLVQRHEREIFPLLRRRHLFAGVENFLLYDFFAPDGYVNEDVYAYSNRSGQDGALVVYHNKYAQARGWIRMSAGYLVRTGEGDERRIVQRNLAQGWALADDPDCFVIFQDQTTGLEYIRNCRELIERGLYVELNAYQYHVFINVRQVADDELHLYRRVNDALNGQGAPSIDEARQELILEPVLAPFRELVRPDTWQALWNGRVSDAEQAADPVLLDAAEERMATLLRAVGLFTGTERDVAEAARTARRELEAIMRLGVTAKDLGTTARARRAGARLAGAADDLRQWSTLLGWWSVHALACADDRAEASLRSRAWIDEWHLGRQLGRTLANLGLDAGAVERALTAVKLLTVHGDALAGPHGPGPRVAATVQDWLEDHEVQDYIQVNRYDNVLWFNKEAFDEWLSWVYVVSVVMWASTAPSVRRVPSPALAAYGLIETIGRAETESAYQIQALLAAAQRADLPPTRTRKPPATHKPKAGNG